MPAADTEETHNRRRRLDNEGVDIRPIPDPTALTTQQLNREIQHLKELINSRLEGMDKAILLLQSGANRSPTINEVFLQHEEKFKSIAQQFGERDTRTEQSTIQTKTAVDAALQAAEKAVGKQQESSDRAIAKSEAASIKQIDQLGEIMSASNKAMDDKISDLKDRMAIMDGRKSGISDGWGFIVGGIGLIIGIISIVFVVVSYNKAANPPKSPEIIYVPAAAVTPPAPTTK